MKLPSALAVLAPLALSPMLGGCVISTTSDYTDYDEAVEVVHLKHAVAATLVKTLEQIAPERDPTGRWQPVRITTDPRTNSVLLAGQRARVDQLVEIVKELDVKM